MEHCKLFVDVETAIRFQEDWKFAVCPLDNKYIVELNGEKWQQIGTVMNCEIIPEKDGLLPSVNKNVDIYIKVQ